MAKALFVFVVVTLVYGASSAPSWSFSWPTSPPLPRDMQTHSQLRTLFNTPVVSLQKFSRPLELPRWMPYREQITSGLDRRGIRHEGVVATTADNKQWLVHKSPQGTGRGGSTVAVDAKHMSSNWRPATPQQAPKAGVVLGNVVKEGGRRYNTLFNNCIHAANNMCKLG